MKTRYRTQSVGHVEVLYGEAGHANAQGPLHRHGFSTAGHAFRDLMPLLADRHRLIAPELPGFGQTKAPARGAFDYTIDDPAAVAI